jgi:hypothetical protein
VQGKASINWLLVTRFWLLVKRWQMVVSGRLWSSVVVRSTSVVARDTSVVVRELSVVATGRQSKSVFFYITLCFK